MSMLAKVTIDEARAAKNALSQQFSKDFANAADPIVVGFGLTRISAVAFAIKVNLKRAETPQEKVFLPDTFQNVAVRYEVVGAIKAANDCGQPGHVCQCNPPKP